MTLTKQLTQALPEKYKNLRRAVCCSRRKGTSVATVASPTITGCSRQGVFHVPEPFFNVAEDYHNWNYAWVVRWKRGSRALMFAGVFFNVLCAGILLGLYFSNAYPDQWTWLIYSGIIFVSIFLALLLLMAGFRLGPRNGHWATEDMPSWATAQLLADVRAS